MAKILLELSHDCFVHYSIIEKTIIDGNVKKPEWVDEAAGLVKGFNRVNSASLIVPELDQFGSRTERFLKVYLTAEDIKSLYRKVTEIEAEEVTMSLCDCNDDLPW